MFFYVSLSFLVGGGVWYTCRKRKLNVSIAESKVMKSVRAGIVWEINIMMEGQVLDVMEVFKHLLWLRGWLS